MSAAKGAAPDRNPCAIDVATTLHEGNGGVPVRELTLDRQELARLAPALAEVAVVERQRGDAGLRKTLTESIQTHLAGATEAVPKDDHRRRRHAVGQVKPRRTGVFTGGEGDVVTGEMLPDVH